MIRMKQIWVGATLVLMFLLVGLLSACGSPAVTPTPQPTPAPREPKRLEAKITIVMGEMFFADEQGVKGGSFPGACRQNSRNIYCE